MDASIDFSGVLRGSIADNQITNYEQLTYKPKINGVELVGDKSTEDLHIDYNDLENKPTPFSGSYNDLSNKPMLNGSVINGNMFTDNYSENEQRIGTWTDGKPLYKRIFYPNLTVPDNAWTNNILGTIGVNIKRCEGYFNLGASSSFPFSYYRSSTEYFTWYINQSADISVRPNMNVGTPIIIERVIIEYTKTTD